MRKRKFNAKKEIDHVTFIILESLTSYITSLFVNTWRIYRVWLSHCVRLGRIEFAKKLEQQCYRDLYQYVSLCLCKNQTVPGQSELVQILFIKTKK